MIFPHNRSRLMLEPNSRLDYQRRGVRTCRVQINVILFSKIQLTEYKLSGYDLAFGMPCVSTQSGNIEHKRPV